MKLMGKNTLLSSEAQRLDLVAMIKPQVADESIFSLFLRIALGAGIWAV